MMTTNMTSTSPLCQWGSKLVLNLVIIGASLRAFPGGSPDTLRLRPAMALCKLFAFPWRQSKDWQAAPRLPFQLTKIRRIGMGSGRNQAARPLA